MRTASTKPAVEAKVDMQEVLRSLQVLQAECWKSASENPMAGRLLEGIHGPLVELLGGVMSSILQEMKSRPHDAQVQGMGVHLMRAGIQDNATFKQIVMCSGGALALVQGLQHHLADEFLLTEALEAIDEIHGLGSLLQALGHLKESAAGVKASLRAFSKAAKKRWSDVQKLPPADLLQILLGSVLAHPNDEWVAIHALQLLSDLLLEGPEWRASFGEAGSCEWLLGVLETHSKNSRIQLHGFKVLSSLGTGGSWGEAHLARYMKVLERAMCIHASEEAMMYWALWAVQRLNGARALVVPLQNGSFKTPQAAAAALRCLGGVALGQSDGASIADMPSIIDAVVHTMGAFPERDEVHYEATVVIGHAAALVVGGAHSAVPPAGSEHALVACVRIAVQALLQLIRVRLSNAEIVKAACQSLGEISDACPRGSPVRETIVQALLGKEEGQLEPLLSIVTKAHVSNHPLQRTIMWVNGVMLGAGPVIQQMREHFASQEIQLYGVRTLGMLFYDWIDLEPGEACTLANALDAVVSAMAQFPEHLILQQHACFALFTIAEHGDCMAHGVMSQEQLLRSAYVVADALSLAQGQRDVSWRDSGDNVRYLRKEATRCIVGLCRVRPALVQWLRERGLHLVLVDALSSTAEGVWDGSRDSEAEETLCLELLALCYILGPSAVIPETLRRWGTAKPAVARAVADVVVELARGRSTISGPACATAAAAAPALLAAGYGSDLLAAMRAHGGDEDLQGRMQLAVGFVENAAHC